MRGLKGLGPLVLIGIAGLAWLLFFSEPGAKWLAEKFAPGPATGPVVARLVQAEGSVKHVEGGHVQILKTPLTAPLELRDGDRLETDDNARVLLVLNSQDEMAMGPLSSVSLQLWNPKDPSSALYLTVMAGDVEQKKPGVRGRAYVVREGRLYLPGQKAVSKPLALTVLRSAPLDMRLADPATPAPAGGDFETDESAAQEFSAVMPAVEPETLSNEYIDETMASRQAQFQKCWLSRLKDKPDLKGQIVVQFEISRRGKVKELKVADSTLNDETLQKCVMTVVERIEFRGFKGPEISLSYPINFE